MTVTVDANILIYASNRDDPVYEQARALLEELSRGPTLFYLFWPVIMAYLRVSTSPRLLPQPLGFQEAVHNVDDLVGRAHIRSPGEGEGFCQHSRQLRVTRPEERQFQTPTLPVSCANTA